MLKLGNVQKSSSKIQCRNYGYRTIDRFLPEIRSYSSSPRANVRSCRCSIQKDEFLKIWIKLKINLSAPELFFLILAHSVYKM